MKIDLHCHTKKVKKGEPKTRDVDVNLFENKIMNADIKICAITNHNEFDYEQYKKFHDKLENNCQVWPGIELDTKCCSDNKWHLIVVVDPKKVNKFDESVQELVEDRVKDELIVDLKEIVEKMKKLDAIFIPHFHKDPQISKEDLEKLYEYIGVDDRHRVFLELPNNKSMSIFANYEYNSIVGSDVKDWNKYEDNQFAELRLPVTSFREFVLLAKRDNNVVTTLLCKKNPISVNVSPVDNVYFSIQVYPEMNIIFGQKGTGKSEILKSIRKELKSKGKTCSYYEGSARSDNFKSLFDVDDIQAKTSMFQKDIEYDLLLKEIRQWKEVQPTSIRDYENWWKTKDNNKNKSTMEITLAKITSAKDDNDFNIAQKDRKRIKEIIKLVDNIDIKKYINDEEWHEFKKILDRLSNSIVEEIKNEYINYKSHELVEFSIDKIKSIADKCSNTKSKPSKVGFYDYAMNRLHIKKNIEDILNFFTEKPIYEDDKLGKLEDKGKMFIRTMWRVLCSNSSREEYHSVKIRRLKKCKKQMDDLKKAFCDKSLQEKIVNFDNECKEDGINSLDCFIGVSKYIVNEKKERYQPSNGEQGILLLQKELDKDVEVYLVDEPELGMGNSYIDQCIRPKLMDLAKQGKIVIVATHNANIAVRTLPYMSIFREYHNGEYRTYTGNPFSNQLVDINNKNNVLIWKNESIHTLEGGKEAFYEREYIYGAESHQC